MRHSYATWMLEAGANLREEDVALDPVDVRLLGPRAVVACANRVTDMVEELRLRRLGRGGFAKDGRGGVLTDEILQAPGGLPGEWVPRRRHTGIRAVSASRNRQRR